MEEGKKSFSLTTSTEIAKVKDVLGKGGQIDVFLDGILQYNVFSAYEQHNFILIEKGYQPRLPKHNPKIMGNGMTFAKGEIKIYVRDHQLGDGGSIQRHKGFSRK